MATREENARLLKKGIVGEVEGIPGELGRKESGGSYTVPTGQPNEVFVRLYGDENNLVTAINLEANPMPQLPVRVRKNSSGRYEVLGSDPTPATVFLGTAAPSSIIPPMVGSAVNVIWESWQFKPGRIRSMGSGFNVWMEELPYGDTDLGDVSGNMATAVGTIASGKKAWIIVSVDPDTNVLAFTKGDDVGLPVPLTKAAGAAVSVPTGNLKLWGYIVRASATYLPVVKQAPDTLYFADYRQWLTPESTGGGGSSTFTDDEIREMVWIGTV